MELRVVTHVPLLQYPETFYVTPLLGYPSPAPYDPDHSPQPLKESRAMLVYFVLHSTRPWRGTGPCCSDCLPNLCKGGLFDVELSGGCGWCDQLSAGGQHFLPKVVAVSVTEVSVDYLIRTYEDPTPLLP